jgi:hypothetical protein
MLLSAVTSLRFPMIDLMDRCDMAAPSSPTAFMVARTDRECKN